MSAVTEAVILMAGSGSRLRGADESLLKPLVSLGGRPLITYALEALVHAGIKQLSFIVGYQSNRMIAGVAPLVPRGVKSRFIENREWQKQNGISVLAAASCVSAPFLLTMSDHLFEGAIVDLLIRSADFELLNVAIDRKIGSVFDLDDAMKLQTRDGKVTAIGKSLPEYDAIDTGLFVCPREFFKYLAAAKKNGDCSLADGVRAMANDGKVRAFDIGAAWWQDVDTPETFQHAEKEIANSRLKPSPK